MKIGIAVPNANRGDLSEAMIVEEEIRPYIRRLVCKPCLENDNYKILLEPVQMQIVSGVENAEEHLQAWKCPKCSETIRVPRGMFPSQSFKILTLLGPRDEEDQEPPL